MNSDSLPMASAASPNPNSTMQWTQASDADLIQGCLDGIEPAWTALIERYSRLIYSIPFRFGFPRPVADEVFQETCLILLEKLETLHDQERLSAWLVTVCRRACLQRFGHQEEVDLTELAETAVATDTLPLDAVLIQLEQQHNIHLALQQLSPRCRDLLTALFFSVPSLSYEEIADQFDIPLGGIGPNRARCLQKLRLALVRLEQ